MRCKFPYFEQRPHIPIAVHFNKKITRFLPLLDSGADFSVFYKSDAQRIGLDWDKGEKVDLENADGTSFKAKQFKLTLEIEGHKFPARLCFVENKKTSISLLGRRDVFKHFKIQIHEKEQYVKLETFPK